MFYLLTHFLTYLPNLYLHPPWLSPPSPDLIIVQYSLRPGAGGRQTNLLRARLSGMAHWGTVCSVQCAVSSSVKFIVLSVCVLAGDLDIHILVVWTTNQKTHPTPKYSAVPDYFFGWTWRSRQIWSFGICGRWHHLSFLRKVLFFLDKRPLHLA